MLSIIDLNIGYHSKLLKKNFSTYTPTTGLIALVGGNGCGKTTLLKTLAGLIHPLSGQVKVHNKSVHSLDQQHRSKTISIVFSYLPYNLSLTVRETLCLASKLAHNTINQRLIYNTSKLLDLNSLIDKKFNTLSDGQKQKVMIARAIVQDTPIILMDEPFSHLDYRNKQLIINTLNQLSETKLIIFATHDELSVLNADLVWQIKDQQLFVLNTHNFISNSHQLKQIYNFYNFHVVNNGKHIEKKL